MQKPSRSLAMAFVYPILVTRPAADWPAARVAQHVVARRLDALPGFDHHMDEAHFLHLVGGVGLAAQHHLLGEGAAATARHQTIGAHAREQAEHRLRKTELGLLLRDDDVE